MQMHTASRRPALLIHEFVTGGGWWHLERQPPGGSLLAEGQLMCAAIAADAAGMADGPVAVLRDARLPRLDLPGVDEVLVHSGEEELQQLISLAPRAAWTLLIAPEFSGLLQTRCRLAAGAGARLLSPQEDLVALAGDKFATNQRLRAAGVPVPRSRLWAAGGPFPAEELTYPAVCKPRYGAGSMDMRRIDAPARAPATAADVDFCVEQYCPGCAVSVAALCGPNQQLLLPACRQHLSEDGTFRYEGGSLPLRDALNGRAHALAARALAVLPSAIGYLGLDLVLGADPGGSDDVVIEVNPRLTTSYVGLRQLCRQNLVEAMRAVAEGRQFALSWHAEAVEFTAS